MIKNIVFEAYWKLNEENALLIRLFLLQHGFGFEPEELILDTDYTFSEGVKVFEQYDVMNEELNMIVLGTKLDLRARSYFHVNKWGNHKLIKLTVDAPVEREQEYVFFNNFLSISGLICAFIYDYEDKKWQTVDRIKEYKDNDKPYTHLPTKKNRVGELVIDTSNNPGRSVHALGIQFLAASKMYFGVLFYKITGSEKLIQAGAKPIKMADQELLYVDLFNCFTDSTAFIREQQQRFIDTTQLLDSVTYLHENYVGVIGALQAIGL